METLQEKEKTLLNLINENQNNEEHDKEKIESALQDVISLHNALTEKMREEIDAMENANKLCNLNLQVALLQYM